VPLSGEWAFYPGQFLPPGGAASEEEAAFVRVPGGWDDTMGSPFGYGTYQLTILLPETASWQSRRLAVQPAVIRSSHTLYVNGEQLGANGMPGADAAQAKAQVMPYVTDFHAEGDRVELVIHVSNYDYAHYGGIFTSL